MPEEDQKTFEQNIEEMSKMSGEELAARIKSLTGNASVRCVPHIWEQGKRDYLCVIGKSTVIEKESGCICPGCPVQVELALKWEYYCTKGFRQGTGWNAMIWLANGSVRSATSRLWKK